MILGFNEECTPRARVMVLNLLSESIVAYSSTLHLKPHDST